MSTRSKLALLASVAVTGGCILAVYTLKDNEDAIRKLGVKREDAQKKQDTIQRMASNAADLKRQEELTRELQEDQ